jgi:hypothetical protein
MKANLKGRGGIKGLLFLHGEKLAIAFAGLLGMWFIYSSLKLPKLGDDFQAAKLQEEISRTNLTVQESKWPEGNSELAAEVRTFKPIAKNANVDVKSGDYAIKGFDSPVIAPSLLRSDPVILSAVDVRAIGGTGLLAFEDVKAAKAQGRRQTVAEEERARKERERQEAESRRPDRREGPAIGVGEVDPDHPTRRAILTTTDQVGVATQGGERIERACWATIFAKVPIREQLKQFQDAFQNARGFDATRDFPRYMGFIVERSQVVPGKPLQWTRVPVYDGQRKYIPNDPIEHFVNSKAVAQLNRLADSEWAGRPIEPVAERYTDPFLTMPLPPLVGRDFGADATHPDIPLASEAPLLEQQIEPITDEETEEEPVDGEDPLAFRSGDLGQTGAESGVYSRSPGPAYGASHGMGGEHRRSMEMSRGDRGSSAVGGIASAGSRTELPRDVDFWLLRFFDFTVKPGKKYKYRVRLVLADPNYGIPASANMLEPAVLDRQRKESQDARAKGRSAPNYRVAPESDASPAVGIPLSGIVRLAEAALPKLHNDEPVVKLWAETFDIEKEEGTAIHVAKDKVFRRGAVVNLQEKMLYTGDGDSWRDTFDSYPLQTGVTVLDVAGAKRVAKDMTAPARVMLMDPTGELSIRNELDDSTAVQQLQVLFTEDKRRGRAEEGETPGGLEGFPGGPRQRRQ